MERILRLTSGYDLLISMDRIITIRFTVESTSEVRLKTELGAESTLVYSPTVSARVWTAIWNDLNFIVNACMIAHGDAAL